MANKTKLKNQATAHPVAPVTVTVLPVVNCAECSHPLPHQPGPGNAEAALTAHYNDKHLDLATAPASRA